MQKTPNSDVNRIGELSRKLGDEEKRRQGVAVSTRRDAARRAAATRARKDMAKRRQLIIDFVIKDMGTLDIEDLTLVSSLTTRLAALSTYEKEELSSYEKEEGTE